ncbi:MAG: S8 family serine peptidase [bacterium]|nr:S8 family serine peptidase [bacterium]
MPLFQANYPASEPGKVTLLSTPERTRALSQYTGKGVVIAFVDSGFYAHPDLGNRVLLHVDATHDYIVEGQPFHTAHDFSWHGQMTSVITAGSGRVSDGRYRGIASQAELVLIKVMNERYEVKEGDILRGLRWLLENHRRYNVRVVNLSVGGDDFSKDPHHPIFEAIHTLKTEGVIVIAAAGNRGVEEMVPPASSPDAITVGGVDDHNSADRAHWTMYHSNYGKAYDGTRKPDLIAPAAWIPSPILPTTRVAEEALLLAPLLQSRDNRLLRRAIHEGRAEFGIKRRGLFYHDEKVHAILQERIHAHKIVDAHHQHVDGTSVAAPILTSIVAQMLEIKPDLTPDGIRIILTATADPLPNVPHEQQGAGVVNAADAVKAVLNLVQPPPTKANPE